MAGNQWLGSVILIALPSRASLTLAAGLLTFSCSIPYLVSIARNHARPQRMSWFVFAGLSAVGALVQFSDGADPGAWLSLGSAFGFGAVFVSSLWRGTGGASVVDLLTLAVAAISVVIALAMQRPLLALATVVAAEIAAVGLTVRKSSRDPHSEMMSSWAIDAAAGVAALAAVSHLTADQVLYPVHHTVVNLWVVVTLARCRYRRTA